MTDGTHLAILLISIAAPIGAFDAIYYHIIKFRLASRPESRAETRTHIARGLVIGIAVLLLAHFEPRGLWFWAIAGLFAVDFFNSAIDAYLERDSRASLGGLPRLEYIIHLTGATFMGAIAVVFLTRGWHLGALETALVAPSQPLPAFMKINALAIALGSFALAAYEAAILIRSSPTALEHARARQ